MKEFTVENMIAACKSLPDMKARNELFDSFRLMYFHGFIGGNPFDAFCEAWEHEFFFVHVKTGRVVNEDELKEIFEDTSSGKVNDRDFEAWKSEKIKQGIIKVA